LIELMRFRLCSSAWMRQESVERLA